MDAPDPDAYAFHGYHPFEDEDEQPYGSFEVFWHDGDADGEGRGWYWHACFPGCLPDGEPSGPFATSQLAYRDAVST